MTSLNLGCGPLVLPGFLNIDKELPPREVLAKLQADDFVRWDLTSGLPEMVADEIDFINMSQFIEHINFTDALKLLKDCHKVLKKGGRGRIRISTPDMDKLISSYLEGSMAQYAGVQPPIYAYTQEQGLKLALILCGSLHEHGDSGHKMFYNFEGLREMLTKVGFKNISRAGHDPSLDAQVGENHEIVVVATT